MEVSYNISLIKNELDFINKKASYNFVERMKKLHKQIDDPNSKVDNNKITKVLFDLCVKLKQEVLHKDKIIKKLENFKDVVVESPKPTGVEDMKPPNKREIITLRSINYTHTKNIIDAFINNMKGKTCDGLIKFIRETRDIINSKFDEEDKEYDDIMNYLEKKKDYIDTFNGVDITNWRSVIDDECPPTFTISSIKQYKNYTKNLKTEIEKVGEGILKKRLETILVEYNNNKELNKFR